MQVAESCNEQQKGALMGFFTSLQRLMAVLPPILRNELSVGMYIIHQSVGDCQVHGRRWYSTVIKGGPKEWIRCSQ